MELFSKTVLFTISILISTVSIADDVPVSLKQFFSSYLEAANSGDLNELRKLTHPNIVECISQTTESYHLKLEDNAQWQFSQIPSEAELGTDDHMERDVAAAKPFMFGTEHELDWKVIPDLRLYISYEANGRRGRAALYVSETPEGWKRVYPCQLISS